MHWIGWLLLGLGALPCKAAPTAASLAADLRTAALDPSECYRVRDVHFEKEDVRLFLTEGVLIFGRAVNGQIVSAVFSAEQEGEDGELLLLPPHRGERKALAGYAGSPNLDEHFRTALFLFTDDTARALLTEIQGRDTVRRDRERGEALAATWELPLRNVQESFILRFVQDLASRRRAERGIFLGILQTSRLGSISILFDPRAREQILVGQTTSRQDVLNFDIWTSFVARAFRQGKRTVPTPDGRIDRIGLDVFLNSDLHLRARARSSFLAQPADEGVLAFELSRQMKVISATIDGKPAEAFQHEQPQTGLLGARILDDQLLILPPAPLSPGEPHEIVCEVEGNVVTDAGNGVYFVGSRGNWYPHRPGEFATYDATFHFPRRLDLVATGEMLQERIEGESKVSRRRTNVPVQLFGFNLGSYLRTAVTRGGATVEVYANRQLERALVNNAPRTVIVPPTTGFPRQARGLERQELPPLPPPDPASMLRPLANQVMGAYSFMTEMFGPPPFRTLTISPIPGRFGQGFPGLVYLSTMAYLAPTERPASARSEEQRAFFSELLPAHETAHQWWGNIVTSASSQDDWLMEALASYSALLYLERQRGTAAMDAILAEYRRHLLSKPSGKDVVDSAGPIIWGARLAQTSVPDAWRVITYEKGSWILHMLRRRLGDQRFFALLAELRRRYEYKPIRTEEFQALARTFVPSGQPDPQLDSFFEQWVYGTGIPSYKLAYKVTGTAPRWKLTGTLEPASESEPLTALVPLDFQFARGAPQTVWILAGETPGFSFTLGQPPSKVLLDPHHAVLLQ